MPDKEKIKSHPFAGILLPDEELLWFYSPPPLTWHEKRTLVQPSFLGCLLGVQLLLDFIFPTAQKSPLIAYGVSNRRLLKRTNNQIVGKPLNKFQIPTKIIYRESRAMLNLGRTSWWWSGIETHEAERALEIIEQAKERFKSLS